MRRLGARSFREKHWFQQPAVQISFAIWLTFVSSVFLLSGASQDYLLGQILVISGFWIANWALRREALLNPVQWLAFLVFWWFSVGPAIIGGFHLLVGDYAEAIEAQNSGRESLWIVGVGLALYGISARTVMEFLQRRKVSLNLLKTDGEYWSTKTVGALFLVGMSSELVIRLLGGIGIIGFTEVNFLGGTKTEIWWLGVLGVFTVLKLWALFGGIWTIVFGWNQISSKGKLLLLGIIAEYAVRALYSGSKGALILIPFVFMLSITCKNGRPPIAIGVAIALSLLVVVEPLTSYGRHLALTRGATTASERQSDFAEVIKSGGYIADKVSNLQIRVLFRGIYPVAGEIARRSDLFMGEWGGYTIVWGLEVLMPRILRPDKPDQNIGNFFARTIGAAIGVSSQEDNLNNIAPSMMFEFVGNYGLLAGVGSFACIGALWAAIVVVLIPTERVNRHPFVIVLTLMALAFEGSFGAFLIATRDLVIVLTALWVAKIVFRYKW